MARCCSSVDTYFRKVKSAIFNIFSRYGNFVGSHPVAFIVLPILVCGGLGLGFMHMERETNESELYNPKNSRTKEEARFLRRSFDPMNCESNSLFSGVFKPNYIYFLFESPTNIFSKEAITEIRDFLTKLKSLLEQRQLCNPCYSECVMYGEYVLSESFLSDLAAGKVYYRNPWNVTGELKDLRDTIASVSEDTKGNFLVSAKLLKIVFPIYYRVDENDLLAYAQRNFTPKHVRLNLEFPHSINTEMGKVMTGDIWMFGLTIVMCSIFSIVITAGGNPVSTRGLLACAGILAAGLSVLGSIGLLCLCDVKFVDLVGVLPFLIVGIGVDDMFLMMASWSETLNVQEMTVPQRLGVTMATAGIGITITSLTNCLAFAVGISSVFLSVRNFSMFASLAVLLCYLTNITLFAGCLALHGRRVHASRHFLTCHVTKPRQDLLNEGRNPCIAWWCGGSPPDHVGDDVNFCEIIQRRYLPGIFRRKSACVVIILVFMGSLGVTSYGASQLELGLQNRFLVKESSYVYRTLFLKEEHFPEKLAIGFNVNGTVNYTREGMKLLDLLGQARKDPDILPHIEHCWLSVYLNSTFYNASSPQDFVTNIQWFMEQNPEFSTEVKVVRNFTEINFSRCSVLSKPMSDQYAMAKMMERMRTLADSSTLPVFAYNWSFFESERLLSIPKATLKLVGSAAAIVAVITLLMLPHPVIVCLVVLTGAMIIIGVFGCMYYWGVTLSTITLIHLILSVGFSVDFSAHVCASYLMSNSQSRAERTEDAIRHAASPVLNGATSTVMGVLILAAADSYIFITFFKVMFLVIMLGLLHAVLFLPAVLSLIGPVGSDQSSFAVESSTGSSLMTVSGGSEISLQRYESSANKESYDRSSAVSLSERDSGPNCSLRNV